MDARLPSPADVAANAPTVRRRCPSPQSLVQPQPQPQTGQRAGGGDPEGDSAPCAPPRSALGTLHARGASAPAWRSAAAPAGGTGVGGRYGRVSCGGPGPFPPPPPTPTHSPTPTHPPLLGAAPHEFRVREHLLCTGWRQRTGRGVVGRSVNMGVGSCPAQAARSRTVHLTGHHPLGKRWWWWCGGGDGACAGGPADADERARLVQLPSTSAPVGPELTPCALSLLAPSASARRRARQPRGAARATKATTPSPRSLFERRRGPSAAAGASGRDGMMG